MMHPQQEHNPRNLSLPIGTRAPLISASSPAPSVLGNVAPHGHSTPRSPKSLDERTKFLDDDGLSGNDVSGNYGTVNPSSCSTGKLSATSPPGAN
jgi:hypothetical protein